MGLPAAVNTARMRARAGDRVGVPGATPCRVRVVGGGTTWDCAYSRTHVPLENSQRV